MTKTIDTLAAAIRCECGGIRCEIHDECHGEPCTLHAAIAALGAVEIHENSCVGKPAHECTCEAAGLAFKKIRWHVITAETLADLAQTCIERGIPFARIQGREMPTWWSPERREVWVVIWNPQRDPSIRNIWNSEQGARNAAAFHDDAVVQRITADLETGEEVAV